MSVFPAPDQPRLTPEELVDNPEHFLPQTFEPSAQPIVWKGIMGPPMATTPLTGMGKYVGQFARGATMGILGDPEGPQNLPQAATEILGMAVPGIAGSALTGGLVGATPVLRTFPVIAKHIIAEGASGALTAGTHAHFTGGDVPTETALGGVTGALGGLAWGLWAGRARGASAPEQIKEGVKALAEGQPPPGPPGLMPAPRQRPPGPWPGGRMRVHGPGELEAGVPGVESPVTPVGAAEPALGPGQRALPPGPFEDITPTPVVPEGPSPYPRALPGGPPTPLQPRPGPAEQLYMPDLGTTQLQLPMDIIPNGRMNRYATPTRYKGTYATAELASSESNVVAQAAAREGARTIRVTTTIQPKEGPPMGGLIRIYDGHPDGTVTLVSERNLNMGAVKAAQVNAAPMRRMIPDYFEVVYNPQLKSDILLPISDEVERGLQIAKAIDPHQMTFPMAPEQISFLNSVEGRSIRQRLDIAAKRPLLDDVMRMDEATAKAVLVDTIEAPPAMAGAVIQPTEDAIRARAILANLEVSDAELGAFLGTMKGRINPKERFRRTLEWLQSKCGGL